MSSDNSRDAARARRAAAEAEPSARHGKAAFARRIDCSESPDEGRHKRSRAPARSDGAPRETASGARRAPTGGSHST
jgi:hypothetical protein